MTLADCKDEEKDAIGKLKALSNALANIKASSGNGLNIFDAVGINKQEIKHSHFLAFLFDIKEKHNMANTFLRKFLEKVVDIKNNNADSTYQILPNEEIIKKAHFSEQDYGDLANATNVSVEKEKGCKNKGRIDIFIKLDDKKTIIVIENKVDANLHDEQLGKYEDEFSHKQYDAWKKIFVYLTKDKAFPIENSRYFYNWCVCGYEDIKDIINAILQDKSVKKSTKLKHLLEDYIEMIDTNILCNNKNIQGACKEIYKQHGEALTILQNYNNNTIEIMNFCKDFLKKDGFVDIISNKTNKPTKDSNIQFFFLSQNLYNKVLKGNQLKNALEIKFCYRIMKEHAFFEKGFLFKKGETTDLLPWQSEFLAKIEPNAIVAQNHNEKSQRREIIVDSSIVNGAFDDAAKADLTVKLEDFVKEIKDFEKSVANIQIP